MVIVNSDEYEKGCEEVPGVGVGVGVGVALGSSHIPS